MVFRAVILTFFSIFRIMNVTINQPIILLHILKMSNKSYTF